MYDTKGRSSGDSLTSGTTGEVYEYLGGMQKSLRMIGDAKYQKAYKKKLRAAKRIKK